VPVPTAIHECLEVPARYNARLPFVEALMEKTKSGCPAEPCVKTGNDTFWVVSRDKLLARAPMLHWSNVKTRYSVYCRSTG
jgi:hypothetical protein